MVRPDGQARSLACLAGWPLAALKERLAAWPYAMLLHERKVGGGGGGGGGGDLI